MAVRTFRVYSSGRSRDVEAVSGKAAIRERLTHGGFRGRLTYREPELTEAGATWRLTGSMETARFGAVLCTAYWPVA